MNNTPYKENCGAVESRILTEQEREEEKRKDDERVQRFRSMKVSDG